MSISPENLTTFTSIVTLLCVKYPDASQELLILRKAIIEWYQGTQQLILQKNKEIMNAKTKGTSQLALLFKEVSNFFDNILRNYQDPNLLFFKTQFKKIEELFEFMDVNFDRLKLNYSYNQIFKDANIQTQILEEGENSYRFDFVNLMENLDNKQNQIDSLQNQIQDLLADNRELQRKIQQIAKNKNQNQEYYTKQITQLRDNLERQKQKQLGNHQKNSYIFRSNPEIDHLGKLTHQKKHILNLLTTAFEEKKQQNETSLQMITSSTDLQLLKFIHCQALAIEGLVFQHEQ